MSLPNTLHFEYQSINNERISLIRVMSIWYSITFPASIVIYGFAIQLANEHENSRLILYTGALFASLVVVFALAYAIILDRAIVRMYPRILALEILLGYHFYRQHLKTYNERELKELVEKCEGFDTGNAKAFNESVHKAFNDVKFPSRRRGHLKFMIAVVILVLIYFSLATYIAFT